VSSSELRSPIKASPLRFPGESLQDEIETLILEGILPYFLGAMLVAFVAVVEWIAALRHTPRQPWLYTIMAALLWAVFTWRLVRVRARVRRLKLGRDGERVVGQFLEGLRVSGARVFHDIPGDGFNLDHVVLSTHGCYVVETKTRRKPVRGDARVTLGDDRLFVSGYRPDRDPFVQARAGADWLAKLLRDSTAKHFAVRGVVVFPGWWVEPMSPQWKRNPEKPWVLEPKALPSFIENEPQTLDEADVAIAAFHLSRYVRATQADRD
jgi:hypothetical protein